MSPKHIEIVQVLYFVDKLADIEEKSVNTRTIPRLILEWETYLKTLRRKPFKGGNHAPDCDKKTDFCLQCDFEEHRQTASLLLTHTSLRDMGHRDLLAFAAFYGAITIDAIRPSRENVDGCCGVWRKYSELLNDPNWENGKHFGACQGSPMPCVRCFVDQFYRYADVVMKATKDNDRER